MTELKNDRYLRALLRQPVDVTPVWMMRQAGRYLPEYKATRAQAGDFMSLCKNAELACEVTLQPLRRYPLDAAILFSDILTIPDAMGLGLYFEAGEGPRFTSPVKSKADVDKLPIPDPEQELGYVMNAVRTIRRELKGEVPLIGFSGSPLFTKGGGQWLEAMAETGCDALGLDWTTDIADARRRVGNKVALQGNMDPSMLYASAPRIEEEVATILAGFGQGEGHVFNLGHGIHQDVDPEHAGVFVEAVHRLSAPYHQ